MNLKTKVENNTCSMISIILRSVGKYIISQYKPMCNKVLLLVGEETNVEREKYKGSFKSSTNTLFIMLIGGKLVIKIKGEGSKEFFPPKDFFSSKEKQLIGRN